MRKNNPLIQNLFLIVKEYGFWILMFAIQKPIFLCLNYEKGTSFLDFLQVIWHGLKLDFCTSAYFCFIPIIICLVNGLKTLPINKILRIYNIVLGVFISIIFAVDSVLFSYWGFHLDATLIFYLNDTKDATNSVTFFDVVRFVLILVPYLLLLLFINNKIFSNIEIVFQKIKAKVVNALVLIILLPVFFVFTRGGVSTATANVGMVYYSQNQLLNLSAINPTFSLMYSMTKREDFSKEYIYMDTEECKTLFDDLYYVEKDTTINVLNTQNPNIVIILLESLSANAVSGVGGENSTVDNKEITPGLNQLAKEGIVFSNCYANAMRTDRGIVSVLTGFLAQPTTSIIKYPNKTRSLPTLARVLSNKGYSTSMLYGGDINFANMRSYFISSGYQDIVSDSDFPIKQKLSKWGVNDEITFDYLFKDIKKQTPDKKFFKTFLTLSSHEPFDVNMHRFKDPYVNSIAYTDSCLFDFISKLKTTPQWKNTLVIVVADHGYKYPKGTNEGDRKRYNIPMLWLGGAVEKHLEITRFVNQTDIPATLLRQMNIDSKDFVYSRNIFNPYTKDYALFVYNNGFCFMDTNGYTQFDCNANKVVSDKHQQTKSQTKKGQAILQTLYRDISKR